MTLHSKENSELDINILQRCSAAATETYVQADCKNKRQVARLGKLAEVA